MSENKRVTFRLNEEEIEKFKGFTEEYNLSQAEAFTKLIEALELSKAKVIVSDRAKEIETIESHLSAIQNIYLTALEINQNAESTIEENFSKELNSKDQTIIDLQEKNKAFKLSLEESKEIKKANDVLLKEIQDLKIQLQERIEEVKKVNDSNSTLNEIVAEYKSYKIINIDLEKDNTELKTKVSNGETSVKDLNNKLGAVQNELDNIKEFYQQQLQELKSDSKQTLADREQTYENTIKGLKSEHKEELQELKKEAKGNIVELKVDYKQELESLKTDKDAIIESLRKEIEAAKKSKTKKTTTKTAMKKEDK